MCRVYCNLTCLISGSRNGRDLEQCIMTRFSFLVVLGIVNADVQELQHHCEAVSFHHLVRTHYTKVSMKCLRLNSKQPFYRYYSPATHRVNMAKVARSMLHSDSMEGYFIMKPITKTTSMESQKLWHSMLLLQPPDLS